MDRLGLRGVPGGGKSRSLNEAGGRRLEAGKNAMSEQYIKLDVWQKSMDMVVSVYSMTKSFPKEELYSLTSQIRRAAISIPANIAEGRAKRSTRDYMRFINIACGSTAELETHIMIAEKLGYVSNENAKPLLEETARIGRMLNGLYSSLEVKTTSETPTAASLQPLASKASS
jgi:four helix bundle protein